MTDYIKRLLFFLTFVLFSTVKGYSQKTIHAVFASTPPFVDGIITPGEWTDADSATDFIQMEPRKGMPATEPTSAYLLFDDQFVYIAMICYHSNPSEIVARIQQRDELTKNDDIVALLLDSYADKRTAYVFFINLSTLKLI